MCSHHVVITVIEISNCKEHSCPCRAHNYNLYAGNFLRASACTTWPLQIHLGIDCIKTNALFPVRGHEQLQVERHVLSFRNYCNCNMAWQLHFVASLTNRSVAYYSFNHLVTGQILHVQFNALPILLICSHGYFMRRTLLMCLHNDAFKNEWPNISL